ncbi:hypothetical protein DSECCO2_483880 [anaerobic digester metagenome]
MKIKLACLLLLFFTILGFIAKAQPGSVDLTFNSGTGANNYVITSAIQADGKIIIGGMFTIYNGTSREHIARLNSDGTIDTTFHPGTGTNFYVLASAIQSDGKIIIGGSFTSYNGSPMNQIARLNADGTLDGTFNPGTGPDSVIYSIKIQGDGKILIGGMFNSYNGIARSRIARLNADGTLDESFNAGIITGNFVEECAIQSDGKIIIGGHITSISGSPMGHYVRLNTDGSLDGSFSIGGGANISVSAIAVQSDDKILIGGGFTSINGTAINRIVRLNADGNIDSSFTSGSGVDYWVNSIITQSDGKIIVAGSFFSYDGTEIRSIARLNSDGTLEGTFDPGSGANTSINEIKMQSDGKIIVVGYFTLFNGMDKKCIVRLNGSNVTTAVEKKIETAIYPNPFNDELIIDPGENFYEGVFEILNANCQVIYEGNLSEKCIVNTARYSPGIYFIKVTRSETIETIKIIKE